MSRFPVAKVNIASGFRPADRPNHFGLDLAGVQGTPVGAPEDGEVFVVFGAGTPDPDRADNTTVKSDPRFEGYGPAGVVIQGKSGRFHLLAHLDPAGWNDTAGDPLFHGTIDDPTKTQNVVATPEVGIPVSEGQQIGRMPSHVGKAGPHTHWEVRANAVDNPSNRALDTVDPKEWVKDPTTTNTRTTTAASSPGIPVWVWVVLGLYLASRRR